MNKSGRKSCQDNTERARAIIGDAVREYRNSGRSTEASLEVFAPFTRVAHRRIYRFFYNQIFSPPSDHELDNISLGFIEAMLWLAAFFEEKAQHCRRKAFAERLSRDLRLNKRNGEISNCSTHTSSQSGLAA